jgi:hypothetical protein
MNISAAGSLDLGAEMFGAELARGESALIISVRTSLCIGCGGVRVSDLASLSGLVHHPVQRLGPAVLAFVLKGPGRCLPSLR